MNSAFSRQAFQPAFTWGEASPAQFAAQRLPGAVRGGHPVSYNHQQAMADGQYAGSGHWYPSGQFMPTASDEDYGQQQQPMEDDPGSAPAQPQGMPEADSQAAPQSAPPLPKPLRDHVIDYPDLGNEPQHQVDGAGAWFDQPVGNLPHPDDEHAWASLGLTPETLPGALLHLVGNRGHKFRQWFGKGMAQVLGDQAGMPALAQVPIQDAFLQATLHPDIQDHFRRYSKDPLGKSINGSESEAMRTLTRAVNTLKDNPGFGQDYGRAAALGLAEAMRPPPNPDLQDVEQFEERAVPYGAWFKSMQAHDPRAKRDEDKKEERNEPKEKKVPNQRGAGLFPRRRRRDRDGRPALRRKRNTPQFAINLPSQNMGMLRDLSVPAHPKKDRGNAVRGMRKEGYPYAHKLLIARDRPLAGGSETVDLLSAQSQAGPKKLIRKGGHAKGKFLPQEQENENFLRALGVPIPRSSYPHADVSDPDSPQRKVADFVPDLRPISEPMPQGQNLKQFFRHLLGMKVRGQRTAEGVKQQIRGHAVAHALIGNLDVAPTNPQNTQVDPEGNVHWIDEGPEGMDPSFGRWRHYHNAGGRKLLHMLMPQPGDNEVRAQMERLHAALPAALEHIEDPHQRAVILWRFEELRKFYAKHLPQITGQPAQQLSSDAEWWQQQFSCA